MSGFEMSNMKLLTGEVPKSNRDLLVPDRLYLKDGSWVPGKSLLGKNLPFEYNILDYLSETKVNGYSQPLVVSREKDAWKIVGVFDNEGNLKDTNRMYSTKEGISDINIKMENNMKEVSETAGHYFVTLMDASRMKIVIGELKGKGYNALPVKSFNYGNMVLVASIYSLVSFVMILFSLALIVWIQNNFIKKRRDMIGLLRVIGYPFKFVERIVMMNNMCLGILSLVLATIGSLVATNKIAKVLFESRTIGCINFGVWILAMLITVGISWFITKRILKSNYKITAAKMIKEVA